MGCTLFKRFLPGITGFYWVLLGLTGSYLACCVAKVVGERCVGLFFVGLVY